MLHTLLANKAQLMVNAQPRSANSQHGFNTGHDFKENTAKLEPLHGDTNIAMETHVDQQIALPTFQPNVWHSQTLA